MNYMYKNILSWILFAFWLVFFGLTSGKPLAAVSNATYWEERDDLISKDLSRMIGHNITLSPEEEEFNDILMGFKNEEINQAFQTLNFLPSKNFISVKTQIDQSEVFKLIQKMPKGAALHLHDMALTSVDWVVSELTYWDDLYMCNSTDSFLLFRFFETPDGSCPWKLVATERTESASPEIFDAYLFSKLSLFTPDFENNYPDINSVWDAFENVFTSVSGILTYSRAWEAYLERGLQEFMEDNVTYFEFRGIFPLDSNYLAYIKKNLLPVSKVSSKLYTSSKTQIYEKNGTNLTVSEMLMIYDDVIKNFTSLHSDKFFGTRFIYAPPRLVDTETMWQYVNLTAEMKNLFPDLVAGFDLVGQEDLGVPLKGFLDPLLSLREQAPNIDVFFHAGETNWQGMSPDENMFDAFLLNSSRIGHGYAITKHPELMQMARTKDVPMEICPISNQVLKLVEDLRNHPAASLVASDFPLVVSSDDPALWEALPLSHDFYEAFMALGGAKADLRFLKQLAINSIKYSSLDALQRESLFVMWEKQWTEFIRAEVLERRFSNLEKANEIPAGVDENNLV